MSTKISHELTDTAIQRELGGRLARRRLDLNMGQEELAAATGVSRLTVSKIENGGNISVANLLRILRGLDALAGVEQLLPASAPSPVEVARLQGRLRKRASRKKASADSTPAAPFQWGDDA